MELMIPECSRPGLLRQGDLLLTIPPGTAIDQAPFLGLTSIALP